jgi:hypothetical protein
MFLDFFNSKISGYCGVFFELKPSLILQIFSPVFVRQIHLQKIRKKIRKRREGIGKLY